VRAALLTGVGAFTTASGDAQTVSLGKDMNVVLKGFFTPLRDFGDGAATEPDVCGNASLEVGALAVGFEYLHSRLTSGPEAVETNEQQLALSGLVTF
jgi:hypothetical protein